MEMTRWQDIDTSTPEGLRVLDRMIATRLGWRFEQVLRIDNAHWFLVFAPRGNKVGTVCDSEEWPSSWVHIPRYTTDANAALALLENTHDKWVISVDHSGDGLPFYHVSKYLGSAGWNVGNADTLALAICLAWLVWSDTNANS